MSIHSRPCKRARQGQDARDDNNNSPVNVDATYELCANLIPVSTSISNNVESQIFRLEDVPAQGQIIFDVPVIPEETNQKEQRNTSKSSNCDEDVEQHSMSILASGRADLCCLARPHLLDPNWTLRAAAQQHYRGDAVTLPPQYEAGFDQLERNLQRAAEMAINA